jgi:predicted metal-dependent hydrolase
MMEPEILQRTIEAFNQRHYAEAAVVAGEGRMLAGRGRDELFWAGLHETCLGYALLMEKQLGPAEAKMAAAIEKLRNFGFLYQNVEVTSILAGLRQGVEEIRTVRMKRKTTFDVTLLPNIKMAAKADQ